MRRKLIPAALALMVIVVATVVLASVTFGGQSQLEANKAAAQRDAHALVARLRLPPVTTGSESGSVSNSVASSAHARWTSNETPRAVVKFIRSHPPAGAKLQAWGSDGNASTGATTGLTLLYSWPVLGSHAYDRSLSISVLYLPRGRSRITATGQSYWIVPRPANERIPASVKVVDVTLRLGHGPMGNLHPVTTTHEFTQSATVGNVVASVNALTTVQPGVAYSCPGMVAEPGRPVLTLVFRAGPAGPALARAQVDVFPGRKGDAGWTPCDPIAFWVGGTAEKALISQTFVEQIARLISADIS